MRKNITYLNEKELVHKKSSKIRKKTSNPTKIV